MITPINIEAEQAVLGALMIDPGVREQVAWLLRQQDFHREAHRRIFAAMMAVDVIDVLTVGAELQRRGDLEAAGGLSYLSDLSAAVPATSNAPHYARIVSDLATLRRLVHAGQRIAELPEEQEDTSAAIAAAEQILADVRSESAAAGGMAVYMPEVIEQRWRQHTDPSFRTEGWPTGFRALDEIIGGFRDGELIVLGARPSMGKTAFALNLARRRAATGNVLLVSLETGRNTLADRLISAETGLSAPGLRSKVYGEQRLQAAGASLGDLYQARLHVIDAGGVTTDQVAAEAWRLKAAWGSLGLVVVDYLTLLGDVPQRGGSDASHVGRMAQKLQAMARNLECPVLLLSQLSREVEHRENKRPILSDLRDSGAIEQAASVVLFLYRPAYYGEKPDGVVEVICAKQKDGPVGALRLGFDAATGRFGDLADGSAPPVRQGRASRRHDD